MGTLSQGCVEIPRVYGGWVALAAPIAAQRDVGRGRGLARASANFSAWLSKRKAAPENVANLLAGVVANKTSYEDVDYAVLQKIYGNDLEAARRYSPAKIVSSTALHEAVERLQPEAGERRSGRSPELLGDAENAPQATK